MKKKTIIAVVVLVLVAAVFYGVWRVTRPDTNEGAKSITVQVVHSDNSTNTFEVNTDRDYLADALLDNDIVNDNQTNYGLYIITADGETVDEGNQEWWCLTRDGEFLTTSASETVIADGDSYELTFTIGYE